MVPGEVLLRFDSVSFEHGFNKPILDEVSFSVRRGTKITLMGQNGAGKSTLFHLISRVLEPDEGRVHIGDTVSVAMARQVMAREQMKYTVREFFAKCLEDKTGKRVYDIDPKIDEVFEAVNLSASHDKKIKTFSGGQQARLLLASALIQNPDLLLLDEPFSGLDPLGTKDFKELIHKLKVAEGKTIFINSHGLAEMEKIADDFAIIDKGKCLAQNSMKSLLPGVTLEDFFTTTIRGKN